LALAAKWPERATFAGSLHKELYVKAGERGAEKAQGLRFLLARLVRFQPL
jgi:hypothetical protein